VPFRFNVRTALANTGMKHFWVCPALPLLSANAGMGLPTGVAAAAAAAAMLLRQ